MSDTASSAGKGAIVNAIEVVNFKPGDVVFVGLDHSSSASERDALGVQLRQVIPDVASVVVRGSVSLAVARRDEDEERVAL